jgi:hypothetical protein
MVEVTTSGTVVQTLTSEFTGANLQTDSGTSTSHGFIGVGGQYLAGSGYTSALGTASVASTNTKVAQIIDATTGGVVTRAEFPTDGTIYGGNSFRSTVPTGPNTFYTGGTGSTTTGGVWYFNGSSFTQISDTVGGPLNTRNVGVFGGQLYVASGSAGFLGISAVGSGLPTTSGQTSTLQIDLGTGGSPYGFAMFDTDNDSILDLAYVADDRTTNVNGGINRFDFNGSSWSRTWALRFNTTTNELSSAVSGVVAIRGLAATYDSLSGTSTLFATTTSTSNNALISFLDDGTLAAGDSFTTLQMAGTNNVFRGVVVAPVPEPSALTLLGGVASIGLLIYRRRRKG